MRGSISDSAQDKAGQVELPESEVQERQGENGAYINRHARKNDPAWTHSVDPPAQKRRHEAEGHRGDCESGRDCLAIPSEVGGEGLDENGKGVHEERAEAGHHSETGGEDDAPTVVTNVRFRRGRKLSDRVNAVGWADQPFSRGRQCAGSGNVVCELPRMFVHSRSANAEWVDATREDGRDL
jgi:hypothetical protein